MVSVYYKVFVIVILILIIVYFSFKNNQAELFYASKVQLHVNDDHEFIQIFKDNLKEEHYKEENYFGQVPKRIAKEQHEQHLQNIKNGVYNYNNRHKKKKEENKQPKQDNESEPKTYIDFKINFK